jgi:aspartate kinase
MIVLKFGGGTLRSAERLERCLDLIEKRADQKPVVVVSAHGDTTDNLIRATQEALDGSIRTEALRTYHLELASRVGTPEGMVHPLLDRLESLLHGIGLLRELTPRTLDHVLSFGERLSSRIVAGGLTARGLRALPVCAYDIGMVTDSCFGGARPLPAAGAKLAEGIQRTDGVPVVTGFIGKNPEGEITTLGRSGSDYTATFLAAAAGAEEVIIYKDVDGVMTADPSVDDRARNIPELSFEEASELAYFGAEVLHPATLLPAIEKNIPVRAINALVDADTGTRILAGRVDSGHVAKSVVYKEDVTLLHLLSPRLHSVPQVLDAALLRLEEEEIVAHMIATSEASISLITQSGLDDRKRQRAVERLSDISKVWCTPKMAIVCLVGEELKGRADTLGNVFSALAKAGINARLITRSASEINLALLISDAEIPQAVRALHSLLLDA